MKNFILFILIFSSLAALKAQQTCATALNLTSASTCNYSTHITTGTEYWLKFTATSPTVNISLITVKFGINATHIHNLALYSGNCSSPILVADDELPFVADAKELAIDLNASGLVIGQTYYLKASRLATHTSCDKSGCTNNGSADPTVFDVCVQDINVIIPLDFGLEAPAISHAYTTNRGQLVDVNGNSVPQIKLYNDQTSPAVYIADDKISYVFSRIDTSITTPDTLHRVDVSLVGSTPTKAFKTEQIAGITNYYLGHISQGATNNKSYSRVVCNEVYPNIDMQYYSNQEGLKYYFIVKPGGDPDNIILKFDGATAINVTPTGGLKIVTSIGMLDFEPPHAYRVNPAGNIVPMPWQAKFEAIPASINEVKFKTHPYDPIMPLFIQVDRGHSQQQLLSNVGIDWSTFYGGTHEEEFVDIKQLGSKRYIVGTSQSTNFPITPGSFQTINSGISDVVIVKLKSNDQVEWATYYGGSSVEDSESIGVSDIGVYFLGNTRSTDFPTRSVVGSYNQNTLSGGFWDGFIVKLDINTGFQKWATYFGGSGGDGLYDFDFDSFGNMYFVGYSNTSVPIVTKNGAFNSTSYSGVYGSFIGKLNNQDNLVWSSFFGSGWINSISCNKSKKATFITGQSKVDDLPYKVGVPNSYIDSTMYGINECFVAKFDENDSLTWSTYYGANYWSGNTSTTNYYGLEEGFAIESRDSVLYVTGYASLSDDFPTLNSGGYYNNTLNSPIGGGDMFILKFDDNGVRKWATLYGGDGGDQVSAITLDSKYNVYITGTTNSSGITFGTQQILGAYYDSSSDNDAFILAFDNTDNRIWSTFYGGTGINGGSGIDGATGIAIDNSLNKLYLVGKTASGISFPLQNDFIAYYDDILNTGLTVRKDGFISRLDILPIVSVEDFNIKPNSFLIYPNPTDGIFNVLLNYPDKTNINLFIYDITGKLIHNESRKNVYGTYNMTLDLRSQAKGVYLVTISYNDKIFHQKVIKD